MFLFPLEIWNSMEFWVWVWFLSTEFKYGYRLYTPGQIYNVPKIPHCMQLLLKLLHVMCFELTVQIVAYQNILCIAKKLRLDDITQFNRSTCLQHLYGAKTRMTISFATACSGTGNTNENVTTEFLCHSKCGKAPVTQRFTAWSRPKPVNM
jgi:hypothetical protein